MAATPSTRIEASARRRLLATAAAAIEAGLGRTAATAPAVPESPGVLAEPRASFVTVSIDGTLRGCCGSLEATRPLLLDVWYNAQASAFRDPRFPPLTVTEWTRSLLEISVLTPRERVLVASEEALLLALVPGRDGLVLAGRGRRATFLPKVWEQLPEPRDFLRQLKLKAGWPADFWAVDLEVWRYRSESVSADRPAVAPQGTAA